MSKIRTQPGFSKLKITWLLLAVAGLLAIGSYGWHVYSLFRDWQSNMPQPQIEKLTKDVRLYYAKTGHFPANFIEINNLIWRTKPAPEYGREGRQARTKYYYYFYTKVTDHTCAIWALPIGPQRHYAQSFFLVISPEWSRIWKGKALDDTAISHLPEVPSPDQLLALGMAEVPSQVVLNKSKP